MALAFSRIIRNEAGLPFLLVFDVAADDVGDIGVLFFLLLDEGVVVEPPVHLDFFLLDLSRFCRRRLLGRQVLSLGIGLLERYGLDLLRLGRGNLLGRNRWPLRGGGSPGARPRRAGHLNLVHRPAFRAVDRIFGQIVEFSAATGAEPFGTQFGFCHGPVLRTIWVLHLARENQNEGAPSLIVGLVVAANHVRLITIPREVQRNEEDTSLRTVRSSLP